MAASLRTRHQDARIAGIRREPSLDAVHRRRSHLFSIMLLVLLALCVATAVAPMGPTSAPVSPSTLRLGLIVLSATFVVYAVEKERALHRLEAALVEEQRRREHLGEEIDRLQMLINAGHAVTATLELDRVVDLALAGALRLFNAPAGAVFLDRGDLVIQAFQGERNRLDLADEHARAVAEAGQAALVPGVRAEDSPGMAAPLAHEEGVVGVLYVQGGDGTEFSSIDLDVLDAFARHAGAAIANARRFRAERTTNEQFAGLRDAQREFRWLATTG